MYIIYLYVDRLELLSSTATPPKGSTMSTIGSQCEVYMQLEGLVDFDKEISRLEEAIRKKEQQRDKVLLQTRVEGYIEKVERGKREGKRMEGKRVLRGQRWRTNWGYG